MAPQRDTASFAANARREIAWHFASLRIFGRPRADAIMHFATILKTEPIRALLSKAADGPASHMAHRRVVEASEFAIPGLYARCQNGGPARAHINDQILREAKELFDFCYNYAQIEFSFRLADRGQLRLFAARRKPRLTFAYADKSADAAETGLRGRELEITFAGERLNMDRNSQARIFHALTEKIQPRISPDGDRCSYSRGPEEVPLMRELARELVKAVPHEMDGDAKLSGTVSFSQLRSYWGALLALSNVHFMAHNVASKGLPARWPLATAALVLPRPVLVERLSEISGLSSTLTETVTSWYVYDPRIAKSSVIVQPLLPIANDLLCMPMLYVNGNNLERNFFKLLNRHPILRPHARAVEDMKEPTALREMARLFPEADFRTKPRLQIPGVTDADLLVFETTPGFALFIQHKWLAAPETVEESSSNDEKLSEGAKQAVKARDAIRLNPQLLRKALQIADSLPINRVEAVTVCRGFEPTGFAVPTEVPIITETSFRRLFDETGSLEALWKALHSRPDITSATKYVQDSKWRIKLAGFEFVMPALLYG